MDTPPRVRSRIIIALLCFALVLFPYLGAYASIGSFSASADTGTVLSEQVDEQISEQVDGQFGGLADELQTEPDETITDDPADGGLTDEDPIEEQEDDFSAIDPVSMDISLLADIGPVMNGPDLISAIAAAAPGDTILLGANIQLGSTLLISKNLTLTSAAGGPYSLIGPSGAAAISVTGGTLTLDNIIVTHVSGQAGRGVEVGNNGSLVMNSGSITGNTITGNNGGGGVLVNGSFMMNGGDISNNSAGTTGGGILSNGSFTMNGGSISSNYAGTNGGGLLVNDFFEINGGNISNNTAGASGGGIYFSNSSTNCLAIYFDGTLSAINISGNKALAGNGGGICFQNLNNYGKLVISSGVAFSNNTASVGGYALADSDGTAKATHDANISTGVTWTNPYIYGYNNLDISYKAQGSTGDTYTVTFNLQGGVFLADPGTPTVLSGQALGARMPQNPVRTGYIFKGWRMNSDGTGALFTSGTAVISNIMVYAIWEAVIAPAPQQTPAPPVQNPPAATVKPLDDPEPDKALPVVVERPVKEEIPVEPTPEVADAVPEPILLNTESVLTLNPNLSREDVFAMLEEGGVPIIRMGGLEVPLSAGTGMPVWAPINQILVTVGIVMVISSFIGFMKRRKKTGEKMNRWLKIAALFAAAGAVVFALTQDTRHLMVLFDLWTPVSAAIFAGALINLRFSSRAEKERAF